MINSYLTLYLKDINRRLSEFQDSITYVSVQYDELKSLLSTNSSTLQTLKDENKVLKENLGQLTTRVKALEDDNIKHQQWVRLQNIEVIGIPEEKN